MNVSYQNEPCPEVFLYQAPNTAAKCEPSHTLAMLLAIQSIADKTIGTITAKFTRSRSPSELATAFFLGDER